MKMCLIAADLVVFALLVACQPAAPALTPTALDQTDLPIADPIDPEPTSTPAIEATTAASTPEPQKPVSALTAYLLTAAARTPIPTFHVSVPAAACWTNSKVRVRTGQTVQITASGVVNTWDGRDGSSGGPDGQTGVCGAIQCPVQGAGYGALIGRLEDLKPFVVGEATEFTATKDGQLHFTVNDWQCEDNSGTFDLVIRVE